MQLLGKRANKKRTRTPLHLALQGQRAYETLVEKILILTS
jgi:hypothetical protein